MEKYKVVCIDDDQAVLDSYSLFFKDYQHNTMLFLDPHKALNYIIDNQKHIINIFSDYHMPAMNGFELRKLMLKEKIDIPFSIVTAMYDKEMAKKGMELKISGFVEKPINEDNLLKIFKKTSKARIDSLKGERELIIGFVQESRPMLDELEDVALRLESNPKEKGMGNTLLRLLHTIKGTAACLGLNNIAEFAHSYETFVQKIMGQPEEVSPAEADILLKAYDYLQDMYRHVEEDKKYTQDISVLEKIFLENQQTVPSKSEKPLPSDAPITMDSTGHSEENIFVQEDVANKFVDLGGEAIILKKVILRYLERAKKIFPGNKELEIACHNMIELDKAISLQQSYMENIKKVPIKQILRTMKRVTREALKDKKKNVDVVTTGDDIMIDVSIGRILNKILVHIVRNSISHGIEEIEERKRLGKSETGKIQIDCSIVDDEIIVNVKDDGQGFGRQKIASRAVKQGFIKRKDLSNTSDKELFQVIFEPGFSTSKQITDLAGRGVGLDMVRSVIEEAKGRIYVANNPNGGGYTNITIPLPRSIVAIKGLTVFLEESAFSIPLGNVLEIVSFHKDNPHDGAIYDVEGGNIFKHRNTLLPILFLRKLLYPEAEHLESNSFMIIILRVGPNLVYGLAVDNVGQIEDLVVKNIDPNSMKKDYFLGVSFIFDGHIGVLLDVEKIAKAHNIKNSDKKIHLPSLPHEDTEDHNANDYVVFGLKNFPNYAIAIDEVMHIETFNAGQVEYSGDRAVVICRERTAALIDLRYMLELTDAPQDIRKHKGTLNIIMAEYKGSIYGMMVEKIDGIYTYNDKIDGAMKNNCGVQGTIYLSGHTTTLLSTKEIIKAFSKSKYTNQSLDLAS